ncbi:F-box protein CPR1-like [Telopea speciosissima]|uniref:F-box protein CPR1-like n=1 Tax=Telopea speciosissima TaxID=54955 RepID=UPI001CC3F8EA|nr:F-box protein CPR1-like [Telopea speciosissima]
MAAKKLPEDLIVEILSRLPVKSLLRFRCVCKPWCVLITDPTFVKMHINRSLATNSNLIFILIKPSFNLQFFNLNDGDEQLEAAVEIDHPPLYNSEFKAELVGSCNGLLCITYSVHIIFLWNPLTRRHQKLPDTPITPIELFEFPVRFDYHPNIVYGFGYDATTEDFKLVRIVQFYTRYQHSDRHYSGHSEVKVYSLSTNSWRRIRRLAIPSQIHFGIRTFLRILLFTGLAPILIASLSFPLILKMRSFERCHRLILRKISFIGMFGFMEDNSVCSIPLTAILILSVASNAEVILTNDGDEEALFLHDPLKGGRVRILDTSGCRTFIKTCFGNLVPPNAKD